VYISRIWGEKTPERIQHKFCSMVDVCYVITWFKFGDDRVKGFRVGWGSSFTLSHWLWWSPLQHSHTTVWACNAITMMLLLRASVVSASSTILLFLQH